MTRMKTWAPVTAAALAVGLFAAVSGPKAEPPRYECTRISVPESYNFPMRTADGKRLSPPVEKSPAFQQLLTTVELPEGFSPVGGGADHVVACRVVP